VRCAAARCLIWPGAHDWLVDGFSRISPKTNLHGGVARRCWGFELGLIGKDLPRSGDPGMDLPSR